MSKSNRRFEMPEDNGDAAKLPPKSKKMDAPPPEIVVSAPLPDSIKLSDDEQDKLRKIEASLVNQKTVVADLYMEQELLRQRMGQASSDLSTLQLSFMQKVKEVAIAHGIDVDDPEKGRWNLNTFEMVFTKITG